MSKPTYRDSIEPYRGSGLGAPLPVPRGRKAPPPEGFTGAGGAEPSDLDYTEWSDQHGGDNTALRTSSDVVGVDVDAYDGKSGGTELHRLEAVHGPLPATYRSSAREAPSGILWFVADPDLIEQMGGEFARGIEIIRHQHRYAVVAPSTHPNGERYRWFVPDGELMNGVPERSALPRLPDDWVRHAIARGACCRAEGNGGVATISKPSDTQRLPARFASVADAERAALDRYASGTGRHDTTRDVILALLRWEERGDPEARATIERLRSRFIAAVTGDGRTERVAGDEFDSMVAGGEQMIASSPTQPRISIDGEPVEPFPLGLRYTDTDNAERFLDLHRDRVRYVMPWRTWLVWDGNLWQRDPDAVLAQERAKDVARRLYLELAANPSRDGADKLASWARASAGVGKIRAMVQLARGMPGVIVDHEQLDADPWALGVGNGWVDLRDGSHHTPDPDKLMTMAAPVMFDPEATAPRWLRALEEWLPDPEVRSYFQRLVGEAIVGTVRDHLLLLIHGDGGNGKGTAIDTLAKLLGPYFIVPHKSLMMQLKHDAHSTERAALFRTRLAVAAETEGSVKLAEASIKELTGGDRLAARKLYENPWQFDPTHSLWLQTNHLPEIAGNDEGIWRRVRVMRWPEKFTGDREDTALKERLATELAGILNWAIAGALAWQSEGLAEPQAVIEASEAYRQEQDQVVRFMEAMGYQLGGMVPSRQIMQDWHEWTDAELGRPLGGQVLTARLESMGLEKTGGRGPIWRGISKLA